jgi:hypothetical protein
MATSRKSVEFALFGSPRSDAYQPAKSDLEIILNRSGLEFQTYSELTADTNLTYTTGTVHTVEEGEFLVVDGLLYEIAAFDASDNHGVTAGDVKFYEAGPNFSTRARLVEWRARQIANENESQDGYIVTANDVWYKASSGATSVSDIPGFEIINSAGFVSVGSFLTGSETDHTTAFQAAIDSLPDADTIPETLEDGELPSYTLFVPKTADGSRYVITSALDVGKRSLTWLVDGGVRIGSTVDGSNLNWTYLNAPVINERGIHMRGFANKKDNAGFSVTMGSGALGDREAGISGYDPDTVETQAYQHERGSATLYTAIGDNTQVKINGGTNATAFTSTGFTIATPLTEPEARNLRVGMFIDTSGTMDGTGGSTRHTTRLVSWSPESAPDTFVVEQWYKASAVNPYAAAVASTPGDGANVIINPLNKVWGQNSNIFLTETDGATFGYTSGSFFEGGFFNNTGTEADDDFNRNEHPFHFYGIDLSNSGDNGGGHAFLARGSADAKWTTGFRTTGAKIGFHYDGISFNDGSDGFVSSSGYIGTDETYTDGTPNSDFLSRAKVAGAYDNSFRVVGGSPIVELGRRNSTSQPRVTFFADGNASTDDAAYNGQIGFRNDLASLYVDRTGAADPDDATILSFTTESTLKAYLKSTTGGISFEGGDVSFDTDTLHVDETNHRVGFGTTTPDKLVHVYSGASGATGYGFNDQIMVEGSGATGINILHPDASVGAIAFSTPSDSLGAIMSWNYNSGEFRVGARSETGFVALHSGNTETMRLAANGRVAINETVPDYGLDVNGTFGFTPGSSVTPVDNGDVVIEATDNTTLTFKLKGSDGVVRTGTLTLS